MRPSTTTARALARARGILAMGVHRRVLGSNDSACGVAADTCKLGEPPIAYTLNHGNQLYSYNCGISAEGQHSPNM